MILHFKSLINAWQASPHHQEKLGNRNIVVQTTCQERTKVCKPQYYFIYCCIFAVPAEPDRAKFLTWIPGEFNELKQDWQQFTSTEHLFHWLQQEVSQGKSRQIWWFSVDSVLIKKNEIETSVSDDTLYYPFILILVLIIQLWMLE